MGGTRVHPSIQGGSQEAEIHPGRGQQSTAGHTPLTYTQRGSFRSPVDLICMSLERTRIKPETVLVCLVLG